MIEFFISLIDFILNIDEHMAEIILEFGGWTYGILFAIVFAETGLVVTPLLPGDSLIFAAATFDELNPWTLFLVVTAAGILGDGVNYAVGKYIGPRAFKEDFRFLKREYLEKGHEFFEKYGGKAIVLGRFVPIVRTFVPFVAGASSMTYRNFVVFNVIGAVAWVGIFTFLGHYFGSMPIVEENFTFVILAIIFLSILPPFIEWWNEKRKLKQAQA